MKRFLALFIAGVLVFSLAACTKDAPASDPTFPTPSVDPSQPSVDPSRPSVNPSRPTIPSVPDASMPPATTPEGDPAPDVPMDFEQAAGQLGPNVTTYYHSDSSKNLAVSGEDVLYQSIAEVREHEDGISLDYTVTTNLVGKLSSGSGKSKTIRFSAAYLTISFPGDNADQNRQFMLDALKDAPINDETKEAFRQLVDGAKIYIVANSELWEMFVDVDAESHIVLEGDTFYFFSGNSNELHHDHIRDDQDRELKHTAYYFDEEGTKWIESVDEYEYFENGHRHTHTFYHPYSTQIKTYYVSVATFDGTTTKFSTVEEYEYYADGTPKTKTYTDENGNPAHFEYDEDGTTLYEEFTDEDGTQITASYLAGGILHRYTAQATDGTYTEQSYYENGNLAYSITTRNDLPVEEKVGNEDGTLSFLRQYYESGNLHFQHEYFEGGYLDSITEFYDTDQWNPKRTEHYMGNIVHQINTYFPNGEEQSMTMYFFTESEDDLRVRKYRECHENGKTAKSYEYDAEGNLIDGREYFENGDWKYSYSIRDDGTVDETTYHENGQMKREHIIELDGSEYIREWNEDSSWKYDYRNFGNGETLEWIYDEKGQLLQTKDTHEDGSWGICEYIGYYENGEVKQTKSINSEGCEFIYDYYENGQYGRCYEKNPDGSGQIIYFDEDGNFLRMEEF